MNDTILLGTTIDQNSCTQQVNIYE